MWNIYQLTCDRCSAIATHQITYYEAIVFCTQRTHGHTRAQLRGNSSRWSRKIHLFALNTSRARIQTAYALDPFLNSSKSTLSIYILCFMSIDSKRIVPVWMICDLKFLRLSWRGMVGHYWPPLALFVPPVLSEAITFFSRGGEPIPFISVSFVFSWRLLVFHRRSSSLVIYINLPIVDCVCVLTWTN